MSVPAWLDVSVPAWLDVAEESTALDELGDFGGDHALPRVVVRGYPPQHVAAEDRQELWPVVVEVDEAAPSGEVVIQRLQLWLDLDVVDGLQLVLWRGLDGVDVQFQVVLNSRPKLSRIPPGSCAWFFSSNRSIRLGTPMTMPIRSVVRSAI